MKKIILSIVISAISISSVYAGGLSGGATEMTQLMNNGELLLSNAQLAKEVETVISQLEIMRINLKKLSEFANNGSAVIRELSNLNNIVRIGQALAYNANNLSEEYSNRYSDFDQFADRIIKSNGKRDEEYEKDRYQKWSRQNLDSIHSAFRTANLQSKYFETEAQTIQEIERKAQTAKGRDQLLQAGIEISSLQANQMIKLRQMIASDMQMQANYQASIIDRQAEDDAWENYANRKYNSRDPNPDNYPKISELGK